MTLSPKVQKIMGGAGVFLLLLVVFWLGRASQAGDSASEVNGVSEAGESTAEVSSVEEELAPPPEVDVQKQLPASPLNTLYVEGLSPERQTEIVGQFLRDYWVTHRSLPTGTFEEIKAALAGRNGKKIVHLPPQHPTISELGFRAKNDPAEVVIHVRSSREGVFDLIYTGEDGLVFTDDDLVRSFP